MNIVREIASWTATLPSWQSDAVRRVFATEELTAQDHAQLLQLLKQAHGLSDPDTPSLNAVPFSSVVETPKTRKSVRLREIHSLVNVNALLPGQSLKFALEGLTVIFGENGAGKSGYARVFKHACHARDKGQKIIGNLAKSDRSTPSGVIELDVDDEPVALRWKVDSPASELLSNVAVFDGHCARVVIDEANEAVYLPYGLDVFKRLAGLCTALKESISSERRYLPVEFGLAAEYSEVSAAGRLVRSLSYRTTGREILALSTLTSEQDARLEQVRGVVAIAKASSPKQRAAQLRRSAQRIGQLHSLVLAAATGLGKEATASLGQLKATAAATRSAADLAKASAFSSEPLKTTGGNPWRVLFEAARAYSEIAYPGEPFPVVRTDAVCLLCQQPLPESAAQRLTRFERFLREDVARRRDEAEKALHDAGLTLSNLKLSALDDDPSLIDEVRAHDEQAADLVKAFFSKAQVRREALLAAVQPVDPVPPFEDLQSPGQQLLTLSQRLDDAAKAFDEADKPEELKRLISELTDLEDRKRLAKHAAQIDACLKNKMRDLKLEACERALDTTAITRRGSELMEAVVTDQLIANLQAELLPFGLRSLPVNLRKVGQKGRTKHQLVIAEGVKPSVVLSEGEQRIIAISSFLAELAAAGSRAPIIFDDPVSSLDHRYREKVARRLVAEGTKRQVVVFTHDVVMLLALEREAREQQVPLLIQTVERSANGPGQCIASPRPWYACSTKERIGILKQSVAKFKKLQADDPNEYARSIKEFYGKLREAWERAIEEVLLQEVIMRFRPSVETQRLKHVTVESGDYEMIESAMTKCSACLTGHDSAGAIVASHPTPDEAVADIAKLEGFVRALQERASKNQKAAQTLIEAPPGRISESRAPKIIELSA